MSIHFAAPTATRRRFLQTAAAVSFSTIAPDVSAQHMACADALPAVFSSLKPLGPRIRPISADEFTVRIHRAQELMAGPGDPSGVSPSAAKYDALFFTPGTSLYYFTGIHWGLSERLLGLLIPRTGKPIIVVPA